MIDSSAAFGFAMKEKPGGGKRLFCSGHRAASAAETLLLLPRSVSRVIPKQPAQTPSESSSG